MPSSREGACRCQGWTQIRRVGDPQMVTQTACASKCLGEPARFLDMAREINTSPFGRYGHGLELGTCNRAAEFTTISVVLSPDHATLLLSVLNEILASHAYQNQEKQNEAISNLPYQWTSTSTNEDDSIQTQSSRPQRRQRQAQPCDLPQLAQPHLHLGLAPSPSAPPPHSG